MIVKFILRATARETLREGVGAPGGRRRKRGRGAALRRRGDGRARRRADAAVDRIRVRRRRRRAPDGSEGRAVRELGKDWSCRPDALA